MFTKTQFKVLYAVVNDINWPSQRQGARDLVLGWTSGPVPHGEGWLGAPCCLTAEGGESNEGVKASAPPQSRTGIRQFSDGLQGLCCSDVLAGVLLADCARLACPASAGEGAAGSLGPWLKGWGQAAPWKKENKAFPGIPSIWMPAERGRSLPLPPLDC